MTRFRFWLYRNILALFTLLAFRRQKVYPLEEPVDGEVQFRPYAELHPNMPIRGLYLPTTFPTSDRAARRLRRIRLERWLIAFVRVIAPAHTPPVPTDQARFLRALYPRLFRKAWQVSPTLPAALAGTDDVIAELATHGSFASGLRKVAYDRYEFGSDWIGGFPVAPGLAQPGGVATLVASDGRLVTESVRSDGTHGAQAQAALIAGLNEELTIFRHNVDVHLTTLTPFALATNNKLNARHPVRRLLHHCFDTVLIGNVELAAAQLSGPRGFLANIFSHQADVLLHMVEDHLGRFDIWDYEPPTQFSRRGTTSTPFDYPYRDNVMTLWAVTHDYVARYLAIYYDGDAAVAADAELASWVAELNRLMSNGVGDDLTRDWLVRLCSTLIHVSTVEHDLLNNVVWDYTTLGWVTPTVAPLTGAPMDQRRSFDLLATLIGTWKPYNMLLTCDVSKLALDPQAASIMADWIARLSRLQDDLGLRPRDPSLSYPAALNPSISN
jgi:arachidonate 15-lipoxygenase